MCEREDYRICCTADTSLDLQTAYDRAAEDFYGTFSGENSSCTGEASTETEETPTDICTGENLLDGLELGDGDMLSVTVGLDDERKLVDTVIEKGCGCPESCYEQFDEGEIYSIRLNMMELEKVEKDMLVLGKLQVMARSKDAICHARKKNNVQRKRVTYNYAYDDRTVCKSTFCFLHHIGSKVLKNLQQHLKENGAVPREHGNSRRLPANAFCFSTVNRIVSFISNYAAVNGLPQPAARSGREGTAPTFLPASEGYNTVHQKYLQVCAEEGEQAAKYHAFRLIWIKCLPHIKFMTPRTDVCHHCESFRVSLTNSVTETEKITTVQEFTHHIELSRLERQYY